MNIDLTFNINPAALKVAADLMQREPDSTEGIDYSQTRVFYNGRERGIAIQFRTHGYKKTIAFYFAEHRSSDGIFVMILRDHLEFPVPFFGEDTAVDKAHEERVYFNFDESYKAAEYIIQQLTEHLKDFKNDTKEVEQATTGE